MLASHQPATFCLTRYQFNYIFVSFIKLKQTIEGDKCHLLYIYYFKGNYQTYYFMFV